MKRLKDLCLVAEGTWSKDEGKFICNYHTKTGHLYMIEIDEISDGTKHYTTTVSLMGNEPNDNHNARAQSSAFINYNDEENYLYEDWADNNGWNMNNTSVVSDVVAMKIKIYEVI